MTCSQNKGSGVLKSAIIATLFVLFVSKAFEVEDGQFTREYSRLYTGLVLGVGVLGLLGVVALLVTLLRSKD